MKNNIIRLIALTLCAVCLLSALGTSAYAIDPIDVNADVSLSVSLISGKTPIPGAEFRLYRVGNTNEWAEFTLCGSFMGYKGAINGFETADEWDKAAAALTEYAEKNKITPASKIRTNSNGTVSFTNNIRPGLYLVVCGEVTYKGMIYSARPCLVCVPNREANSDEWQYDASILVKPGIKPVPSPTPTPPPRLPQTGQLWWPIPALACAGILFILVGIVRRRSSRDET